MPVSLCMKQYSPGLLSSVSYLATRMQPSCIHLRSFRNGAHSSHPSARFRLVCSGSAGCMALRLRAVSLSLISRSRGVCTSRYQPTASWIVGHVHQHDSVTSPHRAGIFARVVPAVHAHHGPVSRVAWKRNHVFSAILASCLHTRASRLFPHNYALILNVYYYNTA